MDELVARFVKMAKDAHRDAREYERGSCPGSYYRGLRRGFLSAARFAKLEAKHEEWRHWDAIRVENNNDGFGFAE